MHTRDIFLCTEGINLHMYSDVSTPALYICLFLWTFLLGALKRMLEIQTGIPQAEINLEGWPSGDSSVSDSVSENL